MISLSINSLQHDNPVLFWLVVIFIVLGIIYFIRRI